MKTSSWAVMKVNQQVNISKSIRTSHSSTINDLRTKHIGVPFFGNVQKSVNRFLTRAKLTFLWDITLLGATQVPSTNMVNHCHVC